MKRSILSLLLTGLLVMSVSCGDSMISESPNTFLNETNLYSSEEGAEAALTGVYSAMTGYHYMTRSFPVTLAMHSGLYFSRHNGSKDLYRLDPLPNGKYLGKMWSDMYRMINRANDVVDNLKESGLEESVKNPILGEVYFLRAVTYFNLVRMWGDVPLTLTPSTSETLNLPRTPKEEVYEAIIADLEKAKEMMRDPADQRVDRPNKYAAYAILAKVYVTRAGNDNNSPYWQDAYDNAIVVYNEGPYRLLDSYSELWAPMKENSEEKIFELQFNTELSIRLTKEFMISKYYANANTWGRAMPLRTVYNDHVDQYPTDPRLETTYIDSSFVRHRGGNKSPKETPLYPLNNTGNWHLKNFSHPGLFKYYVPNITDATTSNINWSYMRYADLLLLLAEIENELNGPSGAYKYVNEVLARARDTDGDGVGEAADPADWSGMTQDEFRSRIMKERIYELMGEGRSWFDVRRRGYEYFLENVIRPHNNDPELNKFDVTFPESEKNMLLPIPSNEINSNSAITPADQNPGY